MLNDPDTEIELIPRIAASHSQGILHTAHEKEATLILMGWRGKRSLSEQVLGSVLDEVIWGSDTPVMIGRVNLPLNCTQRVVFVIPPKVIPLIALKRMIEANFLLAKSLNVPLVIWADASYRQSVEALLAIRGSDHPVATELLGDRSRSSALEGEGPGSFIVVPGFGSRKRVADTLGQIPEQIASSFDGNLAILHFDN